MDDVMRKAFQRWFNSRSIRHFDTAFEAGWNAALRGLESAEPVAWREWVEERLLSWRRVMNTDGDQLALDDFMDQESFHDLIDFVCSEYEGPAAPPASSGTVQVPKEAECKVYVPGLWRCAKCKLDLIATALSNQGHFANNNPQACPNGCGPMWRVTERDQRQEAQRLFEREFDARKEAERKLGDLLARIHRDGGHYTGQHGMEKSVEDAHMIVATLFADERKLEEAERKLRAAKAELEACRADDSGAAICRAAECLPNGYEVCIIVERGAATVTWHYPDGRSTNVDVDADDRLTAEINAATDAAIDAGTLPVRLENL